MRDGGARDRPKQVPQTSTTRRTVARSGMRAAPSEARQQRHRWGRQWQHRRWRRRRQQQQQRRRQQQQYSSSSSATEVRFPPLAHRGCVAARPRRHLTTQRGSVGQREGGGEGHAAATAAAGARGGTEQAGGFRVQGGGRGGQRGLLLVLFRVLLLLSAMQLGPSRRVRLHLWYTNLPTPGRPPEHDVGRVAGPAKVGHPVHAHAVVPTAQRSAAAWLAASMARHSSKWRAAGHGARDVGRLCPVSCFHRATGAAAAAVADALFPPPLDGCAPSPQAHLWRTQSLRHSCVGGRAPQDTTRLSTASVQRGKRCMDCRGATGRRGRAGRGGHAERGERITLGRGHAAAPWRGAARAPAMLQRLLERLPGTPWSVAGKQWLGMQRASRGSEGAPWLAMAPLGASVDKCPLSCPAMCVTAAAAAVHQHTSACQRGAVHAQPRLAWQQSLLSGGRRLRFCPPAGAAGGALPTSLPATGIPER